MYSSFPCLGVRPIFDEEKVVNKKTDPPRKLSGLGSLKGNHFKTFQSSSFLLYGSYDRNIISSLPTTSFDNK